MSAPGLSLFAPEPYASDPDTVLLLHLDGDMVDATGQYQPVLAGGAWTDDGLLGGALLCDGSQAVTLPAIPDLAGGFTVEAWVNLDAHTGTATWTIARWAGVFSAGFEMRPGALPRLRMSVQTDTGTFDMRTFANFSCRRWVHVAFVYDPDPAREQNMIMYIHGHPVALRDGSTDRVYGTPVPSASPLMLFEGLVGVIDEVRISSRPRTPQELRCPWLSGRRGDFEPFEPDVVAPDPPEGWDNDKLWLTAAQAVPTFHAVGLYVPYRHDANRNGSCRVRFREQGSTDWRVGLDLIADHEDPEFRGSLLDLEADTLYEIELIPDDPDLAPDEIASLSLTVRTWPEEVPIAEVRTLPAGMHSGQLVIEARGEPDGWILYAAPDGQSVEYDAETNHSAAVVIRDSAYVILQNIIARGGTTHGILILDSHDVRVRRCEITGWGGVGEVDPDTGITTKGINSQDGIRIGRSSRRIVVEDNFIHTPRGSANSWIYGHPVGPHALLLGYNGSFHNVIRNNEMIGGENHWWNDAIEGSGNQAIHGGPYRDTDVYGNMITFVNDNAFEFDGGQINVRFWGNRMEYCYRSISFSPCLKGPGYAFRNLVAHQGAEFGLFGSAHKMGSIYTLDDVGWNLIMHNTVYGPGGTGWEDRVHIDAARAFKAWMVNNLCLRTNRPCPWQPEPDFVNVDGGDFHQAPGSAGIDAGIPLANVNEGFEGSAPDLGVFEAGMDGAGSFPPRHEGMGIWPQHVLFTAADASHFAGLERVVHLTIPAAAGTHWTARPNEDWIECEPAGGLSSSNPQTMTVRLRERALDPVPWRGVITIRTDQGYNASVTVRAKVRPAMAWNRASGGSHHDSRHWYPIREPGPDDQILFGMDESYAVTFDKNVEHQSLTVPRGEVLFNLNGFRCTVTNPEGGFRVGARAPAVHTVTGGRLETAGFRIGNDIPGGRKWLVLSGPGTVWTNSSADVNNATVGYLGHGGLRIEHGSAAHLNLLVMNRTSGSSDVMVVGPNSLLRTSGITYAGYGNGLTGSLRVAAGGRWEALGRIVYDRGSVAITVSGEGSRLDAANALRVGYGSTGNRTDRHAVLSVSDGGVLQHTFDGTDALVVGRYDFHGLLEAESGGRIKSEASVVNVGVGYTGMPRSGMLRVRDTESLIEHTGTDINLGLGEGGHGVLHVFTGGVFRSSGALCLGATATSSGLATVAGTQALLQAGSVHIGGLPGEPRGHGHLSVMAGGVIEASGMLDVWGDNGHIEIESGTVSSGALAMHPGSRMAVVADGPQAEDSILVEVSGSAILADAALDLGFGGAFAACEGDRLALLSADTITGGFTNITDGAIIEQGDYRLRYEASATRIELVVLESPLGGRVGIEAGTTWERAGHVTGGGRFIPGQSTELTAHSNPYFFFTGWEGDVPPGSLQDNPLSLPADMERQVTARFEAMVTANTGTPLWWLADHGLTNQAFELEALIDHNDNSLPAWKDYILDLDPRDPEGRPPRFRIERLGDIFLLDLDSTSTKRWYQIEWAPDLVDGPWNPVAESPGSGEAWAVPWEPGDESDRRYLRVRVAVP